MKPGKSNKKCHVIIVSFNGVDNSGGVERVSYYLHEILREKYQVRILTKTNFSFGKFDIIFQPVIASFRLFFMRDKWVIVNSYQAFLYPADIVISHGTFKGNYTRIKPKKLLGSKFIAYMEKIAALLAKKVLAVSINCKNELIGFYNIKETKIKVLNNFVDELIFFPRRKKRNAVTILFCGRLEDRKGLPYLRTFSEYLETIAGFKLRIAANNAANCEYFTGKHNTEVLTSLSLQDMPEFYNSGDVLFFPTLYEGFSMATLEALACGIPVIGSDFAIPEELCGYDFCKNITGKLDNPEYIVTAIKELCEKYGGEQNVIHNEIAEKFGKEQYKNKLLGEIVPNL
jgi:glycosyltransferase involved in cell wall biosynthesis